MNLTPDAIKNRLKSYVLRYTNRMEFAHELDYPEHKLYLCDNVRLGSCAKEPDTVRWIETHIKKDDVVFDIGANVGAYSLIMALYARQVLAFEPAVTNFRLLSKNILFNAKRKTIPGNISAFNIAFSDKTGLETLSYVNTHEGKSGHQIGQRNVDGFGTPFVPAFDHHTMCFTVDDWIDRFELSAPSHLKVDVDGIEDRILRGAQRTLSGNTVRSVMVEITDGTPEQKAILPFMAGLGFRVENKFCASPGYEIYNYLFIR